MVSIYTLLSSPSIVFNKLFYQVYTLCVCVCLKGAFHFIQPGGNRTRDPLRYYVQGSFVVLIMYIDTLVCGTVILRASPSFM